MADSFADHQILFFENPRAHFENPWTYGVLYLIRRDILTCLGWDLGKNALTDHRALWPAAMALLAGVDLLAKFYVGSDDLGAVGDRFRLFVEKFFRINAGDEELIYQLRNALLHSFGLFAKSRKAEFRFGLSNGSPILVTRYPNDQYLVDLSALHTEFDFAVEAYRKALLGSETLQVNFEKMFPNYGSVRIV